MRYVVLSRIAMSLISTRKSGIFLCEVCVESKNMDADDMLYRDLGHVCSGAVVFAICTGFSR